jgi:hypothetical protein
MKDEGRRNGVERVEDRFDPAAGEDGDHRPAVSGAGADVVNGPRGL